MMKMTTKSENIGFLIKILFFCIVFAFILGICTRLALVEVKAAAPETAAVATSGEPTVETATPTDPTVDDHPYLSKNSVNGESMTVTDILLSIRNVLIMFMFFEMLKWGHQVLKGVISGFHKRR